MAPIVCCASRDLSSPDGLPPRPAIKPSPRKLQSAHVFYASISTASPMSNPNDAADLQAIFDTDKSSILSNEIQVKPKKSSSTIEASSGIHAVTNRLRKHLSRESAVTISAKRHSRSSLAVGRSEEEIQRRAELRRIRQKRIEQELSRDDMYDDDAKSLSTIPAANSTISQSRRATWYRDYLPPPSLTPPNFTFPAVLPQSDEALLPSSTSMIQEPITHSGSMISISTNTSLLQTSSIPPSEARSEPNNAPKDWTWPLTGPDRTLSRRHSFPASDPVGVLAELSSCQLHEKDSGSFRILESPILHATTLPSITDSTLHSSWRLSFGKPNRGKQLRKLIQEYRSPPSLSSELSVVRGRRPLKICLQSPGLHPSPQALLISEDPDEISPTQPVSDGFGRVDGSPESLTAMHLNEMRISQQLGSHALNRSQSSLLLSNMIQPSHQCSVSSSAASSLGNATTSPYTRSQRSIPLSEQIPDSWGNIKPERSSSCNQMADNSLQPSPSYSHFGSHSTKTSSDSENDISKPNDVQFSQLHAQTSFSVSGPEHPSAALAIKSAMHSRATVRSSAISETESHRQLEAELSIIQTRFAGTPTRFPPVLPISSKFREEFDLELDYLQSPSPKYRRRSTFSRLGRIVIAALDGPMEKMLGVPLPPPQSRSEHIRKASHPVSGAFNDGFVLESWRKAVEHAQEFEDMKKSKRRSIFQDDWRRQSNAQKLDHANSGGDLRQLKPGDSRYVKQDAEREAVMNDWEKEMENTARRAKDKSKRITQKANLGPDRRYPASWSKFPSHDRVERTERMTRSRSLDKVERKDFAVHSTDDGSTTWYKNERSYHLHHHDGDDCSPTHEKGILKKIEDRIKFNATKSAWEEAEMVFDQTFGRRGSMVLASELEYPELEILPMDLMTSDEIEEHVEDMIQQEEIQKEEDELQRKEEELDAIFRGPRKIKPESAISKARKAADELKAKQAADSEAKPRKKKKLDQFGMGDLSSSDNELPLAPKSSKEDNKTGRPSKGKRKSKRGESTGRSPGSRHLNPSASPPDEEMKLDTAGMNADILEEQIAAMAVLKKKMEEARKAGGIRRGPVARPKPKSDEESNPEWSTSPSGAGASEAAGVHSNDGPILNLSWEQSQISIADPRFYDDCIVTSSPGTPSPSAGNDSRHAVEGRSSSEEEGDEIVKIRISTDERSKTWSGKVRYRNHEAVRSTRSLGDVELRKSTDDFKQQLARAEVAERERTLSMVEEAWGKGRVD